MAGFRRAGHIYVLCIMYGIDSMYGYIVLTKNCLLSGMA